MIRSLLCLLVTSLLLAFPGPSPASEDTPVGTWRTIDDATGAAKSLVEISMADGKLQGKVIKVLQSDQGPNPICKECEGERRNQPVVGMTILWGLERDGAEWNGGQILDPANGKTYKCKISLLEDGQKLEVRGYIGVSLFGRSQVWERVTESSEPATSSTESSATASSTAAPAQEASAATAASTKQPAAAASINMPQPAPATSTQQPQGTSS